MKYKVFTIEQANELLKQLEPLVSELIKKRHAMTNMHEQLLTMELVDGRPEGYYDTEDGHVYLTQATSLEDLIVSFEKDISAIAEMGCILRDIEQGVVDFYHVSNETLVLLSWHVGEKSVGYWYNLDSTHHERLPLEELHSSL